MYPSSLSYFSSPATPSSLPSFSPTIEPSSIESSSVEPSLITQETLIFEKSKESGIIVPSDVEEIQVQISLTENKQEYCTKIFKMYLPDSFDHTMIMNFTDMKIKYNIPNKIYLIAHLFLGQKDDIENFSRGILEINTNICDYYNVKNKHETFSYFNIIELLILKPLNGVWILDLILSEKKDLEKTENKIIPNNSHNRKNKKSPFLNLFNTQLSGKNDKNINFSNANGLNDDKVNNNNIDGSNSNSKISINSDIGIIGL